MYWHPPKRELRPGDRVRHARHGFGVVIEADRRAASVRFHGNTIPRNVDTVSLSITGKPTAETMAQVEMTRKAEAARLAYLAEAKRLRDKQAA